MITVWIYINTTNVPIGDREHVKAFADQDAADAWFRRHDPEGVAFEYPVIGEALRAHDPQAAAIEVA